jgi:hypothetical protein
MIKTIRNYLIGGVVLLLCALGFAGPLMYPELMVENPGYYIPLVQHHIECPIGDILPYHMDELSHSHMCEKSDPFIS